MNKIKKFVELNTRINALIIKQYHHCLSDITRHSIFIPYGEVSPRNDIHGDNSKVH